MKNFITYLALSAFLVVIGCSLATAQVMHKEEALPIIENISGMFPAFELDLLPNKVDDEKTVGSNNTNTNSAGSRVFGTEEAGNISVAVYPNPAKNTTTVEVDGALEIQIEIFNVIGQIVKVEQNIGELIIVNLDDVSAGIYLIRIKSNLGESIKQIRVVK